VPVRGCTVIAVEGTHASGKTTLVHALVGHYRERGIHMTCVEEPARQSPFMEDIVLRGRGIFDMPTELDAYAAMLTAHLRAARNHEALVTDKTPLNVVAYARLLLPPWQKPVTDAMLGLFAATASLYDAVLYVRDTFNTAQPGDTFRSKVAGHQVLIDSALREAAIQAGVTLIEVPVGLTTAQRISWISAHLAESGVLRVRGT
jgi:nicotinamide riboside kinase